MKTLRIFSLLFFVLMMAFQLVPVTANAASLIMVDCNYNANGTVRDTTKQKIPGTSEYECGFPDAIAQIQKLINAIFLLALPIVVISITWSGIQILLAQGNSGALNKAKELFRKVIVGFLIVLVAWIFVYNISSYLLCPRYYTPFLGGNIPDDPAVAACKN